MTSYRFAGQEIELAQVSDETYILLNRQHTGISELAQALHVRPSDVESFLHTESPAKPLLIRTSKDACKIRMLCLLGFAGTQANNFINK